jgi:lysophospholipase L1-like esterase
MLGFCLFWVGLNFHSAILARAGQPPLSTSEDQERAKTVSAATVVFTGSSSIAYWETLEDDMKPLKVINTAIGGAQYTELIDHVDDLVIALHPSAVVVYAGDNDLVTPSRKTPESVAGDVQTFVKMVHAKLPNTWIYVLSIKPSYLRSRAWPKMKEANQLIEEFLRAQDRAQFIDVASPMFDANGDLPHDLFIADRLHPSAKCYALWSSIIKPILLGRFRPSKTSLGYPATLWGKPGYCPVLLGSFLSI